MQLTSSERPEEWAAAWMVAAHLRGLPVRRQPPGHDYDINVDGRVIALEVTTSTPEERSALHSALQGANSRGRPEITTTWQLTIPDARPGFRGPMVKKIETGAPPHLRELERAGVAGFGRGHETLLTNAPEPARRAAAGLLGLGLIAGSSVGPLLPKAEPLLLIGTSGEGAWFNGTDLNPSIESAAYRKLRQLKAATDADERHLFIVVDSNDYVAHAALTAAMRLPAQAPVIDQAIDAIWVGAWLPGSYNGSELSPVLRLTRGGCWQRLPSLDVHAYAAEHGAPQRQESDRAALEDLGAALQRYGAGTRAQLFGRRFVGGFQEDEGPGS